MKYWLTYYFCYTEAAGAVFMILSKRAQLSKAKSKKHLKEIKV